jgi:hypothetical protein
VTVRRPRLGAWYGGVLGGLTFILLLGFLYSAIADRLAFAFWALVVGVFWVVVLRQGLLAQRSPVRLAGSLALVLGAGLAVFGLLERRHHEILDLGFRATFPAVYHPAATRPGTALAAAAALLLAGAGLFIVSTRKKT